jgi:hypothetical protein
VARRVLARCAAVLNLKENSMKKLIAALVLATSFAALADDAAKAPAPAKTEKKADAKDTKATPAPAAKPAPTEKAPEKK